MLHLIFEARFKKNHENIFFESFFYSFWSNVGVSPLGICKNEKSFERLNSLLVPQQKKRNFIKTPLFVYNFNHYLVAIPSGLPSGSLVTVPLEPRFPKSKIPQTCGAAIDVPLMVL